MLLLGHTPDMERPVNYQLPRSDCVGSSLFLEQTRRRSKRLCRRLITLIFADRALQPASMVVIRRELPRTSVARSARGLSHRSAEGPPFRVPSDRPLIGSMNIMLGSRCPLGLSGAPSRRAQTLLDVYSDRPDEAQQLARDGGDRLLLGLALADQPAVTVVQPVLGLPSDRFDLLAQTLLALAQRPKDCRAVPIGPGGLTYDAAQVRVAGLGDGAAPGAAAARVFAGNGSAVAHELARAGEAGQSTDLGDHGGRGHLGDAPQGLQRLDDRPHGLRGRHHRRVNGPLQPCDATASVIHLREVVEQHRLLRRALEVHLLPHPVEVLLRPGLDLLRGSPAVPQQELVQSVSRPQLVALGRLPRPYQVAQRLVLLVR